MRIILFFIVVLMISGLQSKVFARMPDSKTELLNVINRAKVLSADSKISVSIGIDKNITVSTYTNPAIPDKNLIIDSVLISKAIIDCFNDVVGIRFLYYNPFDRTSYRHVVVPRNIVIEYGNGQLTKEQLVNSLTLGKSKSRSAASTAASGNYSLATYMPKGNLFLQNRLLIYGKLKELEGSGYNAEPLFKRFITIEKTFIAQTKIAEASSALQALDKSIDTAIMEQNMHLKIENGQKIRNASTGSFVERRNLVLAKMMKLQQNGVDVSEIKTIYDQTVTPYVNDPRQENRLDSALRVLENKLRFMR